MMHSIDMHCDTLMAAAMKNVEDLSKADLREMPGCSIDFKRLHEARAMAPVSYTHLTLPTILLV